MVLCYNKLDSTKYVSVLNPILNLEIRTHPSPRVLLEECYSKSYFEGSSGGGVRNSSVKGSYMRGDHWLAEQRRSPGTGGSGNCHAQKAARW